jgi:hypothetical protein
MTAGPRPASHCRNPFAPGSHRCRGRGRYRDRDRFRRCIVVGPHARCSLVARVSSASSRCGTARLYGSRSLHPVARVQSHLLSFDSDSDTDADPDYNLYRDRDASLQPHYGAVRFLLVFRSGRTPCDAGSKYKDNHTKLQCCADNGWVRRFGMLEENGGFAIAKSRRMIHA